MQARVAELGNLADLNPHRFRVCFKRSGARTRRPPAPTRLPGWLAGRPAGQLASRLTGWGVLGLLAPRLAGWLAGLLAVWL